MRKGISQTVVSEYTGHQKHAAANNWENSYNFPELASVVAAAELLDVSIDWLVWGDDVANGIAARIRKVPKIFRDALIMRLSEEIEKTEEMAKNLPPEMLGNHLRDADERVKRWADANLRKRTTRPRKPQTKAKGDK